jgi:hypothetical protein
MTQPTVGTESVVSARMYPLTKNSQLFQSSRTLSTLHCHSHSLACILAPLQNNAQFTATAGVWLSTSLAHQANELCTTLRPQTGPQKPLSSAPAVFHKQRGVWETQCLVNPLPAPGAEHLHTPDPILHKQATADSVRAGCKKKPSHVQQAQSRACCTSNVSSPWLWCYHNWSACALASQRTSCTGGQQPSVLSRVAALIHGASWPGAFSFVRQQPP